MKNLTTLFLIISIKTILLGDISNATTYYVATTGNDSNPGTSSQPWLTIAHAESVVSAGDIVMVNNGTYSIGALSVTHSGSSGSTITFKAVNSGNVTLSGSIAVAANFRVFDGFAFNGTVTSLVTIDGSNNIISNSSFTGSWTRAIWIKKVTSVQANNNLIQDVTVTVTGSTGYGIEVGDDNIASGANSNSNILNRVTILGSGSGTIHGVLFGGNSNNVLKNSYISNTYYGLVDKGTTGTLAFNNVVNMTIANTYAGFYAKGSTGSQYYNNVLRCIGGGNCIIIADDPSGILSTGAIFKNNIFIVGSGGTGIFWGYDTYGTNTFTSDYNLFNGSGSIVFKGQTNTTYSTLSSWQSTGQDTHSLSSSPSFANSSGTLSVIADFKPTSSSPVIDAGTTVTGRTTDAEGNSIVGTPDIGAYEFQSTQTAIQSTQSGNIYYVSTTGNDSNPGTFSSPFRTLQKISTLSLLPGDIVYIRAGTYNSGSSASATAAWRLNNIHGQAGNPITIAAYPADFPNGGRIIFNCLDVNHSSNCFGIDIQSCSYITFRQIYVKGPSQQIGSGSGTITGAWWSESSSFILFDNCEAGFSMTGFRLDDGTDVTYNNCDAHDQDDPYTGGTTGPHNNSDGFARTASGNTATNTVYKGCRSWWNSDDGWDCFNTNGTITYDHCWSFWNGYLPGTFNAGGDGNGFKMAGSGTNVTSSITRFASNCLAFQNRFNGFDQNGGNFIARFYNNTSFANGANGWKFGYFAPSLPHVFKNNISFGNNLGDYSPTDAAGWVQSNNNWNGFTVSNSDFQSVSNTGVNGSRQSDGSLPSLSFLHLASASKLIDAGTNVGLPFSGTAPDIATFEYGGTITTVTNQPPTAKAGTDQNITLPTNSVTLSGSGTDADGTIASYQWTKVSGPSQYTIVSPTQAKTTVSNLAQGIYLFELKVTDDAGAIGKDTVQVTVNAAPANQPPTANAGLDMNITLPTNSVTLSGGGSDPDGTIASYQWTKVSGPSQYTIVSPTQAKTTVSNLAQGIYLFELKVTDDAGATGKDTVQVTVNAAPANQPPTANAGLDINITLPTNSVTLSGSGSDPDGTIASYQWTKVSGPSQYTIVSPTQAKTTVSNLAQGIYLFELKVTDDAGASGKDTVQVTVNAAPANQPPTANAGLDINITLPTNSVTLSGSGSDPDGTIASYQWTQVSGPSNANISSPTQPQTVVKNLNQGIYKFELKVTDNLGATGKDTVQVTVNGSTAQTRSPKANAGGNKKLTLPTNSTTLSGTGTNGSGSITTYSWKKISGPAEYTITSPTLAQTTVKDLTKGTYQFELTVTDNLGLSGKDTAQITVVAAAPPNHTPVVDAGSDLFITLPANSVSLSGTGTDADGTIASYKWTEVSGPAQFTLTSSTDAQTTLTDLVAGDYEFELKVTDNLGAVGRDTVKVIVSERLVSIAKIFPNPASSLINIQMIAATTTNNTTIRIYDAKGIVVHQENFVRQQQTMTKQIQIENLPRGVYYLEMNIDINKIMTLMFVKQ